jgi:uncharacterized protein (UPF0248 family)
MIKEIELKIPTSYEDISLQRWLSLQNDLKNYSDDDNAVTAVMFLHLCGLEPTYLKNISIDDYALIKSELESFISNTDLPLQRIITIDGKEYGFEPNLSKMTYGAYADITAYKELTIDDNWAKIMDILYRPIVRRKGEMYLIEPYKGEINPEKWLSVGMHVHFGCLFFFVNLLMDLLKSTLNSTMEMEFPPNIKSILEKSGQHIPHSLNLPVETLLK